MTPAKQVERDAAVGARLEAWMHERHLKDGQLAKLIGTSAPSVQGWRKGTRPFPHWWPKILEVTGLDFSDPDGVIAGKIQAPKVKKVQKAPMSGASFESLTRAYSSLMRVRSGETTLDLTSPEKLSTIDFLLGMVAAEMEFQGKKDTRYETVSGLREIVAASPDPLAALRFLRTHANVDKSVLDAVEESLPRSTGTGTHA